MSRAQLSTLFRNFSLFGIGLSWGGFESLALLVDSPKRSVLACSDAGPLLRIHAGLEDVNDLIDDMTGALDVALRAETAA